MKKILFILMLLILIASAFFFLFPNSIGLIEMFANWIGGDPPIPVKNEIVMPPNSTVTAKTDSGTISIKSGEGLKRYYTWEGVTRSVVMGPREERWYGSFGIYYPGPENHWLPKHNGISRGVLEEGQQHFDTLEEAEAWVKKQCPGCVYNDNGLVVCFSKELDREQLNVDIWQIYIGGQTPSQYQETGSDFQEKAARIFGQTQTEADKDLIYGGRKSRIYHTGGKKPSQLMGSNNSAITLSWDNVINN